MQTLFVLVLTCVYTAVVLGGSRDAFDWSMLGRMWLRVWCYCYCCFWSIDELPGSRSREVDYTPVIECT